MSKKTPYDIIQSRYVTEKSSVLENLKNKNSNPSLARCQSSKYVFLVTKDATKPQIAEAVEEIYADRAIRVVSVNTCHVKAKPRRVRGRSGMSSSFKKAIVTLRAGDQLEN
jgi:large subunit ribosomal protein L23